MRLIPCFLALTIVLTGYTASAADSAKSAPPEKKRPSMFARPKKQTPAEQLAYADSLRDSGRISEAARHYNALVHTWSDSAEAPAAQLAYARLLEKQGDYSEAFDEYEYLIQRYTGSFQYSDVLESEFRIANCIMTARHKFLGILPGSPRFETALSLFEKIVLNGPQWSGTPQAQFNIGWIHEQLGDYDLAVSAYEVVQQNYPKSKVAGDAAFRQGCCLYLIARDRPHEERSLQVARTYLQKFLRAYPDHGSAADAAGYLAEVVRQLADMAYDRALFYDKGEHLKSALIAYTDFLNKFPDSAKAGTARKRMEELEKKVDRKETAVDAAGRAQAETRHISGPKTTVSGEEEE